MLILVRNFFYALILVLMRSFSYTPDDTSSEVFLSVTLLMLILVRSFSYTNDE